MVQFIVKCCSSIPPLAVVSMPISQLVVRISKIGIKRGEHILSGYQMLKRWSLWDLWSVSKREDQIKNNIFPFSGTRCGPQNRGADPQPGARAALSALQFMINQLYSEYRRETESCDRYVVCYTYRISSRM